MLNLIETVKSIKLKENHMKAKEVMETLEISRRTLSRYITRGVIKGKRLPTGQYIYDDESVYELAGKKADKADKAIRKAIKADKDSCIIVYIVNNK